MFGVIVQNLVTKLLTRDVKKRLTASQAKLHSCMREYSGLDPWPVERQIWIAHLKNIDNQDKCLLAQLPKDVIKHILLFLKDPLFT